MIVSLIPWSAFPLAGLPHLAAALRNDPKPCDAHRIEWFDDGYPMSNLTQVFRSVLADKPIDADLSLSGEDQARCLSYFAQRFEAFFENGKEGNQGHYQTMGGVRDLLGEAFVPARHRLAIRYLRGREPQIRTYEYVTFVGEERHACEFLCEISLEAYDDGGDR